VEEKEVPTAIESAASPRQRAARGRSITALLLLLASLVAACAASRKPTLPTRSVRTSTTEAPAGPAPPSPGSAAAPSPGAPAPPSPMPPVTIVIDDPTPEADAPSLLEASRLARERRETARPPIAVITNQNLAEYAKRGNLTIAQPAAKPASSEAEATNDEAEPAAPGPVRDEFYWRDGVRELREKWRQAADELADLQEKAAALRQQFYSEDDPYYRDSRIKPAWDRVLDRLTEAKTEVQQDREKLDAFLEDGRKSEALPGWLREGIELEPDHQPEPTTKDLRSTDATEPVIVNEDPPRP
jgi:hypothetical protein